jgi:hypothetical protein
MPPLAPPRRFWVPPQPSDPIGPVGWRGSGTIPVAANPIAAVSGTAVNGAAATYMRSDAAPRLANTAVVAGNYTLASLTVDAQGRLTAAASGMIALTGDVTGSGGASVPTTLATVNSNIGTFAAVAVNGKGLVTSAANLSGDATTSAATITLATVNGSVGQFESLTVNGKGLVTAAAPLSGYGTTAAGVLTVNRVRGITNGSNAIAGDVGEYLSANVPLSPGGAIASGTVTNMTSLSLTAGDWDVGGNVTWSPAAATIITNAQAAVSTTSATLPDNSSRLIATAVALPANDSLGYPVPVLRVNVTVTTTLYLAVFVLYSSGTLTVCGNIWARRMR